MTLKRPAHLSNDKMQIPFSLMVYHLALTKLATSRANQAFRLLISLLPHYSSDASFWLRLAECCSSRCNEEGERSPSSSSENFHERSVENFRKHMEVLEKKCNHMVIPSIERTLEFGEYACHRVGLERYGSNSKDGRILLGHVTS
jgi:hypothetical protein